MKKYIHGRDKPVEHCCLCRWAHERWYIKKYGKVGHSVLNFFDGFHYHGKARCTRREWRGNRPFTCKCSDCLAEKKESEG